MRQGLSTDVGSYQQIARAAPQLPMHDLPQQHAERFASHWLVGVLSNESMLHAAYYVAASSRWPRSSPSSTSTPRARERR